MNISISIRRFFYPVIVFLAIVSCEKAKSPQEYISTGQTMEKELEYLGLYNDPYVKHIRSAINTCLSGGSVESYECKNIFNLDNACLKGGFIVLQYDIAPMGGRSIVLMPRDFTDRAIYFWVYKSPESGFEVRGVEIKLLDNVQRSKILNSYKKYLDDKSKSI